MMLCTRNHPLNVSNRLDEFRDLKDGWFEGKGLVPDSIGLDWLSECFEQPYLGDLPLPHTFPTPDGGIEMEWFGYRYSLILTVDLKTHKGSWLVFQDDSEYEEDRILDLDSQEDWQWLQGEIRNLTRASA